jgi:hypothetical protein
MQRRAIGEQWKRVPGGGDAFRAEVGRHDGDARQLARMLGHGKHGARGVATGGPYRARGEQPMPHGMRPDPHDDEACVELARQLGEGVARLAVSHLHDWLRGGVAFVAEPMETGVDARTPFLEQIVDEPRERERVSALEGIDRRRLDDRRDDEWARIARGARASDAKGLRASGWTDGDEYRAMRRMSRRDTVRQVPQGVRHDLAPA